MGFGPSDDKAYNASLPLFVKGKFFHINLVAVLLKYFFTLMGEVYLFRGGH